ncbi:MAG: DoxX family protein [Chitinophagaceae bacterium]|nr:DoxX family protein [Chitinophagaceae bacterium]
MKILVNIARFLVGTLFIFSGLVKAIDPLGLTYKMREFFEVWANDGYAKGLMMLLNEQALAFSIFMITLEVLLGLALLIGWMKKLTSWLLLLLTVFFTFLTAFVLFTGKIRACGCFGDCIPLTPVQTFTKDLVLLVLIIVILAGLKHIRPLFGGKWIPAAVMLLGAGGILGLQYYVLNHLPLKDCLPYRIGNNILELRKMPKDAVQDKYTFSFIYEKNGEKKEFAMDKLPDSSWTYVDRKQTLIEKGRNNTPLINDFSLTTLSGNDSTEAILSQLGEYYLLFVRDEETYPKNWKLEGLFFLTAFKEKRPVYIVTAQQEFAKKHFLNKYVLGGAAYDPVILTCDGVAIKTAARNNPVLFLMKGPVVKGKWGWTDMDKLVHD